MPLQTAKKFLTLNQKWYLTLCVGVILNLGYNVYDFFHDKEVAKQYEITRAKQDGRIAELENENLKVKKINVELLSKNFINQRQLDRLPVAIWRKRKVYNSKLGKYEYPMDFNNIVFDRQFMKSRGLDRYYYNNKTDSEIFAAKDAADFYSQDSLVDVLGEYVHFNKPFKNLEGKMVKDGFSKWEETESGQTYIWGMMDTPYEKLNNDSIN